jgi:hypothetical protein
VAALSPLSLRRPTTPFPQPRPPPNPPGSTGSTRLNLSHLDPTGLVGMQLWAAPGGGAGAGSGSLLLCVSPSKRFFRGIQSHIDNAVHGVMQARARGGGGLGGGWGCLGALRGGCAGLPGSAALGPALTRPPPPPPPQGYLVGVTVKGVGYRLEPADASDVIKAPPGAPPSGRRLFWEAGGEKVNVAYPHKQPSRVVRLKVRLQGPGESGVWQAASAAARRCAPATPRPPIPPPTPPNPPATPPPKVGFTNAAVYKLPDGVAAFFLKPTLLYLYGVDKALVTGAAAALRAVRPPNTYTGNGVMLLGEEVKLRQRAGSK